jgi:alpha-1,3-glucosyltransferase
MKYTVYFQRGTVLFSELPYLLVLAWIFGGVNGKMVIAYLSIPFTLLDSTPPFNLDIHFQYNIIMQAIFLLSVQLIRTERFVLGAFVFSVLLNFKHIYLYAAIAYFIYILKEYILKDGSLKDKIVRLVKIGAATLLPFVIAFLSFVYLGGIGQINQIFSRLFPFQRGLIHEYWAPNFWALYYFLDKVAHLLLSRLGMQIVSVKEAGELHNLRVLPDVAPLVTTIIILLATVPLIVVLLSKRKIRFEWLVFLCGTMFFLFGFHVH